MSAVRGLVDYCASVRRLVPAYRSQAHSSIRAAKRRCGRPKRKEHYRKPGLSRGHPCNLSVASASSPAPATLIHTLLHPAAPGPHACTRTSCTLHHATQRRLSNRGPMSLPSTPPKILACIYTSTESSTVPQYSTPSGDTLSGHGPWTVNRAWPSPPLTVEGQSRSPLACPSSVSAMGDSLVGPRLDATSWLSSHPPTVGCDDHRPLRGAGAAPSRWNSAHQLLSSLLMFPPSLPTLNTRVL